jgi:hypothetical protein
MNHHLTAPLADARITAFHAAAVAGRQQPSVAPGNERLWDRLRDAAFGRAGRRRRHRLGVMVTLTNGIRMAMPWRPDARRRGEYWVDPRGEERTARRRVDGRSTTTAVDSLQ